MFKIRHDQFKVFEESTEAHFIQQRIPELRSYFFDETSGLSDEELLQRVQSEVADAKMYSLTKELDVGIFINLSMVLGKGFIHKSENQWMRSYLTDSDVPNPSHRIRRLSAAISKSLTQEEKNQAIRQHFDFFNTGDKNDK